VHFPNDDDDKSNGSETMTEDVFESFTGKVRWSSRVEGLDVRGAVRVVWGGGECGRIQGLQELRR